MDKRKTFKEIHDRIVERLTPEEIVVYDDAINYVTNLLESEKDEFHARLYALLDEYNAVLDGNIEFYTYENEKIVHSEIRSYRGYPFRRRMVSATEIVKNRGLGDE